MVRLEEAGSLPSILTVVHECLWTRLDRPCDVLIGLRMKRAGSRWKEETGEHIIKLRALALSDLWEGAMTKLMATQRTAVRSIAA